MYTRGRERIKSVVKGCDCLSEIGPVAVVMVISISRLTRQALAAGVAAGVLGHALLLLGGATGAGKVGRGSGSGSGCGGPGLAGSAWVGVTSEVGVAA